MPAPNSTPPQFHELSVGVSKRLQWMFWIANSLGLLAIFLSAAPVWLKVGLALALLIHGGRQWWRDLAQSGAGRIVGLRWQQDQFQIRFNRQSIWCDAELLPGSRYWPGWLVLKLDVKSCGRRQLILPSDIGDRDLLRRLQLLLQGQTPGRSKG